MARKVACLKAGGGAAGFDDARYAAIGEPRGTDQARLVDGPKEGRSLGDATRFDPAFESLQGDARLDVDSFRLSILHGLGLKQGDVGPLIGDLDHPRTGAPLSPVETDDLRAPATGGDAQSQEGRISQVGRPVAEIAEQGADLLGEQRAHSTRERGFPCRTSKDRLNGGVLALKAMPLEGVRDGQAR